MTLDGTFHTHLWRSWPLTSTMKRTWMPDPGVEMNETYGLSASEVISQDNSALNYFPDLSRIMLVWLRLSYPNLSLDMQV